MRRWVRSNGEGEAVMSWKFFLGLLGILLTLTVASLGWAARGGATARQVEVNTLAIAETRGDFKVMDEKLDRLVVGQTRIEVRLGINTD